MKTLAPLLVGAALSALTPLAAQAGIPNMSFAVHDVSVTSNVPALNVSVRNLSSSTDPAQRDLRVVSPTPVLNVSGQVWCKSFQNAYTRADAAQILFGNAHLHSTPDGVDVYPIGPWSPSQQKALGADEQLRNYSIQAPVEFPDHWGGGISLTFNPVREVEKRLENYVQNGAGSAADFLRVDDVFETTITMNAVGWCDYDSQNLGDKRYAGLRSVEVPVHIFYHGDPDLEDQVAAVGSAGSIQAQDPPRRGRDVSPPRARRETPSRGGDRRTRRPERDPGAQAAHGDVFIAIPDIDGESEEGLLVPAIQRQQEPREMEREPRQCSAVEDTIRREAGNLVVGWILGSDRPRRGGRQSNRDRMVEDTVDRVVGC